MMTLQILALLLSVCIYSAQGYREGEFIPTARKAQYHEASVHAWPCE